MIDEKLMTVFFYLYFICLGLGLIFISFMTVKAIIAISGNF